MFVSAPHLLESSLHLFCHEQQTFSSFLLLLPSGINLSSGNQKVIGNLGDCGGF